MPLTTVPATNQGLISTYGQYYNRTSNSFSGILGSATYPNRSLSNLYLRYVTSGYCLYLNIATSNSTKGSVSITYPWSETSSGTSTIGNNRQVLTSIYTYIGITCNLTYGYTFKGWYTLPSGGTQITTAQTFTVAYNNSYVNNVWYAQFL